MIINPGLTRGVLAIQRALSSASFFAPLKTSIAPTRGEGEPTFTRNTVATVMDGAYGILRTAKIGEARFQNARRVENLLAYSQDVTNASWSKVNTSATSGWTPDGAPCDIISETAVNSFHGIYKNVATVPGNTCVVSFRVQGKGRDCLVYTNAGTLGKYFSIPADGSGTVLGNYGSGPIGATIAYEARWYRISITFTATTTSTSAELYSVNGASSSFAGDTSKGLYATDAQLENVTGQSHQGPSEYVSNGVLSFPYHGCGVDGVQYFPTDINGTPLPDNSTTQIGYLAEPQRTSYLNNPASPATQTTGIIPTGTYTLSVVGSGYASIIGGTLVGVGFGTATAGNPVQITVSVAGTAIVTVSGSPAAFQLENGVGVTSIIPGTTAPITRDADPLGYQAIGNIGSAGAIYLEFSPLSAPLGRTVFLFGSYQDSSNYIALLHDSANLIMRCRISGVNYDAASDLAYASNTRYKISCRWSSAGVAICTNGGAVTAGTVTGTPQIGTTFQVGSDGNGGKQPGAVITNPHIWQRPLSDAQLQMVTK